MITRAAAGAGSSARPTSSASRAGAPSGAVATRSTALTRPSVDLSQPAGRGEEAKAWESLVAELGLQGPAKQFAAHCVLLERAPGVVRLQLDPAGEAFRRPQIEQRIAQLLSERYGETVRLDIVQADRPGELPTQARREALANEDRQRAAEEAIEADPAVRAMREVFGATVKPGSVRPL